MLHFIHSFINFIHSFKAIHLLKVKGNFKVLGREIKRGTFDGIGEVGRDGSCRALEVWYKGFWVSFHVQQEATDGGDVYDMLKKILLEYWKFRAIQQFTRKMIVAWIREIAV